jgi:glycosyltransferase involved in cell wall biosynthesis
VTGLRVVHVTSYYGGGGAATAALRLHAGLRRLGVDSLMFVGSSPEQPQDPTVRVFSPPTTLLARVRRRIRRLQIGRSRGPASAGPESETFSDDRSLDGADLICQIPPADIVHLHAMLHLVDYQAFFRTVPRRTPVVRTMHDMSFFTGGCHYDFGCGRYKDRCGACPQLGSHDEVDLTRRTWLRKRTAFDAVPLGRLHLVAPSRWLAEEARRSTLVGHFPITVIPYGLDTEEFRPRDKASARETLGIPAQANVVLFVAEPLTRCMKGFALLAQALNEGRHLRDVMLVSAGSGTPPAEVTIPHLPLGHVRDPRRLALLYSAADLCVVPSIQDNFPQTALEATACGTPVVGFAVGGIADIVRPGLTGLLVPPHNVAALGAAIHALLEQPARRAEMSANCRRIAVEEYPLERQPRRYLELYESILGNQRAAQRASDGTLAGVAG